MRAWNNRINLFFKINPSCTMLFLRVLCTMGVNLPPLRNTFSECRREFIFGIYVEEKISSWKKWKKINFSPRGVQGAKNSPRWPKSKMVYLKKILTHNTYITGEHFSEKKFQKNNFLSVRFLSKHSKTGIFGRFLTFSNFNISNTKKVRNLSCSHLIISY